MRLFRAMRDEGVRYVVMEVSSQALARHRVRQHHLRYGGVHNLSPDHRHQEHRISLGQQSVVGRAIFDGGAMTILRKN